MYALGSLLVCAFQIALRPNGKQTQAARMETQKHFYVCLQRCATKVIKGARSIEIKVDQPCIQSMDQW